jgi:hypothetical protein
MHNSIHKTIAGGVIALLDLPHCSSLGDLFNTQLTFGVLFVLLLLGEQIE